MTNTLNKIMHNGNEYDFPEWFTPETAWTTWDVLTKTANGYDWDDAPVTSVNGNTWAVTVNDVKIASSAPTASDWKVWYDTANHYLKYYEDLGGWDAGWITVQEKLPTQTAYTSKWTATKVPTITTNSRWQVTAITETNISFPVTAETVVSGDSGTTYTIKVSNSDPASWTPATTITFVS